MLFSSSGSLWAARIDVLIFPHGDVLCRHNKAGARLGLLLKLQGVGTSLALDNLQAEHRAGLCGNRWLPGSRAALTCPRQALHRCSCISTLGAELLSVAPRNGAFRVGCSHQRFFDSIAKHAGHTALQKRSGLDRRIPQPLHHNFAVWTIQVSRDIWNTVTQLCNKYQKVQHHSRGP